MIWIFRTWETMGTISLPMIRFYPVCRRRDFNGVPPRIRRRLLCHILNVGKLSSLCGNLKNEFFSLSSSRPENLIQISWCEFLICCKPLGHRRKNKESDGKCERKMVGGISIHFEVDDYLCTYKITDSRLDCWTCCSTHVTCDEIVFALLFVCVCVCVQMRNCFVIVVVFVVGYSEGRQMRLPIGL